MCEAVFCEDRALRAIWTMCPTNLNETPLLFQFETASCENLAFIPMAVRFNLDRFGLRISLAQWQALSYENRQRLACFPVDENVRVEPDFGHALSGMLHACAHIQPERFAPDSSPAWRNTMVVPDDVLHQARLAGLAAPDAAQWAALMPFQRYALGKLSRKPESHRDFTPAMREFGLIRCACE